jgi:hypothetical protein
LHSAAVAFIVTVAVDAVVVVLDDVVADIVVVVLFSQRANPSGHVRISVSLYVTQKWSPLSLTQGPAVSASQKPSSQLWGSTVGALVGAKLTDARKLLAASPKHSSVFGGHVRTERLK